MPDPFLCNGVPIDESSLIREPLVVIIIGGIRMKKHFIYILLVPLLFYCLPLGHASAADDASNQVIYDILVDRFNNADQSNHEQVNLENPLAYHGGDIEGITQKLDEIKELGFTMLSLSPIMANTQNGYHGYWIENFYEVEEQFGTMDDLRQLVDEAHKREMKVLLEFVPNYVSKQSPLATDPAKADWIVPNETVTVDAAPWLSEVAVLNQQNEAVQAYLLDAAQYWMDEANVDGLRLYGVDEAQPAFLERFTAELKENNPAMLLTATVLGDNTPAYLLENDAIDLLENRAYNRTITNIFSNPDQPVKDAYEAWNSSGSKSTGLLQIDTPFTPRFTQQFAEQGRNSVTAWKLALTYLYTTPGVPSMYQGSEIPMYGGAYPDNQRLVDFNSGDSELKEFYTRISALRNEFPALRKGDYKLVGSDKGMSVFSRSYENETIYIAINNDSESRVVSIDGVTSGKQLRGLLGDNITREGDNGAYKIGLDRETAEVYTIEEDKGLNWLFIAPILLVFFLFIGAVLYLSKKQKKRSMEQAWNNNKA